MHFSRNVLLSALVAGASAISISSQCQSTLVTLAASPDAQCIDASALTGLFLQGTGSSIVGTVDTWLKGVCSVGSCSNATLATLVSNATAGCGTEISSLVGTVSTEQLTAIVQEAYPTVREVACLQNTTTSTNCVTETLTNIQSTTGTLSITEISNLVTTIIGGGNLNLPSNTTCTSCTKEAYNVVNTNWPGLLSSESSTIQSTCGAEFLDGTAPSGIKQTASNSTFATGASSGGAGSLSGAQAFMSSILVGSLVLGAFAAQ